MIRRAPFVFALLVFAACADSSDVADDFGSDVEVVDDAPAPQIYNSSLNLGDETLESGEFSESYEAVAREGQWLRVQVVSGDFDPYLLILSPTGEQTDVDDSSAGNTSMTKAVVEVTEGGEWQIVVTSYEVGESGAYELSVEVLDERPDDADEGQQGTSEDTSSDTLDA